MSVLQMQRAFGRILTDAEERREFLADRTAYIARYDLAGRERESLSQLDEGRLQQYARLVIATRIDLPLNVLPLSRALLPDDFVDRYGPRFMREFPASPTAEGPPQLREVYRLVEYLNLLLGEGKLQGGKLADALLYEATAFRLSNDPELDVARRAFEERQAWSTGRSLSKESRLVRSPGSALEAFEGGIPAHGSSPTPLRGETVQCAARALMLKRSGERKVHVFALNHAVWNFLQLCDGHRTLQQIARALGADEDPANLAKCEAVARDFVQRGVLGFADSPSA